MIYTDVTDDTYMCNMIYTCVKWNVVVSAKPLFYTFVHRKKNFRDMCFEDLSSYHQNIKLTVAVNPLQFLDTELIGEKEYISTQVFNKPNKFPVHWSSKNPIISAVLLLENFTDQNEQRPMLIMKYRELEKNIEIMVFHQILLVKLSKILKKKQKKLLYPNGFLKK